MQPLLVPAPPAAAGQWASGMPLASSAWQAPLPGQDTYTQGFQAGLALMAHNHMSMSAPMSAQAQQGFPAVPHVATQMPVPAAPPHGFVPAPMLPAPGMGTAPAQVPLAPGMGTAPAQVPPAPGTSTPPSLRYESGPERPAAVPVEQNR